MGYKKKRVFRLLIGSMKIKADKEIQYSVGMESNLHKFFQGYKQSFSPAYGITLSCVDLCLFRTLLVL